MNIGVYDVDTNKIVSYWNGVTYIEKKGVEVHFLHEGVPVFFHCRRDNYVIVDETIELYEGMDVTDILEQDRKGDYQDEKERLKEEIKTLQDAINFLLGL